MNRKQEIALLLKRNSWERAEQLCQTEILHHPTDPETWFYLGAVQSVQGRRAEAIRSLKAAASYIHDDVALHRNGQDIADIEPKDSLLLRTAQALLRLRAYADALPMFERMAFGLPPVILGLGRCRWGLGRYEEALINFHGLWQARPQWADLTLTYARALLSLDSLEQAELALSGLVDIYPNEPEVLHQYTTFLLSQQGDEAAWQWISQRHVGTPSMKFALLRRALMERHDDIDAENLQAVPGNERELSQWESYQALREQELNQEPGSVRWFGDNTALIKHLSQRLPEQGAVVECGVFYGRSLRLLANWTRRECHGFDSFAGLPEAWSRQEPAGAYSTQGHIPSLPPNVRLHQGWFEDTLPDVMPQLQDGVALLHVDCDLYSSTQTVLQHLLPRLKPGSIIVFDDYAGYPEWREHEYKAWQEAILAQGIKAQLVAAVMLGRSVAFQLQ